MDRLKGIDSLKVKIFITIMMIRINHKRDMNVALMTYEALVIQKLTDLIFEYNFN